MVDIFSECDKISRVRIRTEVQFWRNHHHTKESDCLSLQLVDCHNWVKFPHEDISVDISIPYLTAFNQKKNIYGIVNILSQYSFYVSAKGHTKLESDIANWVSEVHHSPTLVTRQNGRQW